MTRISAACRTGAFVLLGLLHVSCGDSTAPDPPPQPTTLSAEAASTTAVDLTWSASGDPDAFELERVEGTDTTVIEVSGTARSHTDTGLSPDQRYYYRVRACDGSRCSEFSASTSVRTFEVLEITTGELPDATLGAVYSKSVLATGGDGAYVWEIVAGSLPDGLALNQSQQSNDAIISGTPEQEETTTFTLRVESEDGQTAEEEFTLEVSLPTAVVIENIALPPVVVGGPYEVLLEASAGFGSGYEWSIEAGSLPPGLELVGDTIRGTPTSTGTFDLTLQVRSGDLVATEEFTIVVTPHDTATYNITPFPVVDIPDDIQPHVDEAVARWEEVLTGNLEEGEIPAGAFEAEVCAGFGDAINGTALDDIIMIINIRPIDGPGSVLGQAGPCLHRGGPDFLPAVGVLTLDSEDLEPMIGSSTLTSVLFHEMGHILGFGLMWSGLREHAQTDSSAFTGVNAVAEYHALGGTGNIPLATTGGAGTRDAHWSESEFNREIMTGFSEQIGIAQPLSRMTIASMADIGYEVNLDAADPYSLTASLLAEAAMENHLGFDRILHMEPHIMERDGTVRPARRGELGPRRH